MARLLKLEERVDYNTNALIDGQDRLERKLDRLIAAISRNNTNGRRR